MFQSVLDEQTHMRLFEARDAGELFRLVDRERVALRQWLPWVEETKVEQDSLQFIRQALRKYAENGAFDAGIWHQGKLVGAAGFHPISWGNKNVSIGYWLAHGARGKGLMTKAVATLTHQALRELKLHRVEIRCATQNSKSQGVPKRLGFALEGTLRQSEWLGDRFVDHLVFSMLSQEWKIHLPPAGTASGT
jgi:ribosomal-protein-serine acetyltransferase